jgi:UDP-N-acetylglucosamine 2-epimerase
LDKTAKSIALNEGVPEKLLYISGNPYHEYLKRWKPSISKEEFFFSNGLNDNSCKIILYVPDPVTNVGGKEAYGFDEITSLDLIIDCLKNIGKFETYYLIIKPHPNQNKILLKDAIDKNKNKINVIWFETINTNNLLYYSDLIIGLFSNILIEASILKKSVIRLITSTKKEDPLRHILPDNVISDYSGLKDILENCLNLRR